MEAVVVGLGLAVLYALTRSGNHRETEDSVAFAVRVRDAPPADLLEGTHLAYLTVGRAFASLARAAGLTEDPLRALQMLDAILAGAAIGGLWLLLRSAGLAPLTAAASAGTAALSYGYWRNAVEVEVYAFSAAMLVGCLAAAWFAARAPGVRAFAVLGLANGVAVLAHVTNVLFAFAAAAAVVLAARAERRGPVAAVPWVATYVAAAAFVVLPAYGVAAAVHGLGSPAEVREWFFERTGEGGDYGTVSPANLAEGAFGSGRALLGGHFALSLEPIREFLMTHFAGKTFSEELFFLEGLPRSVAVALLVLTLVAAASVASLAAGWLRRPALDPEQRTLAILAVTWLVPFALVILWWEPLNIELWYAVWLPAAVLLGLPLHARNRGALVVTMVGATLVVNFVGSVLPQRDEDRDLWRAKTSWYRTHVRPDDLVVSNGYVWSSYLRYLVDAEILDIEDVFREVETEREALRELRRRVAAASGRVLVSGEAFHAFADRRSACLDAPRTCAIAAATARELRDECELLAVVREPFERVWGCPLRA